MESLIGQYEVVLYCQSSFSLKDKRQEVQSLLDTVRESMNVSAAEVDHQDHHRLSRLAFATVSSSRVQIEQVFENLRTAIEEVPTLQIRDTERRLV
jgi:uncharacterized protein YlxP (DUF503 family)